MSSTASNQHSVHATYIQQDIFQYLRPSKTESLGLEIPASLPKEERGLESHITARFLIPRQHLDAFEKDPDGYVASHPWIHSSPPLFRGHVLTRVSLISPLYSPIANSPTNNTHQVAIRVFRNKTAVQADLIGGCFDPSLKAKGRKDFLKRNDIKEVTPQMIAYAALQVLPTAYHIMIITPSFLKTYIGLSSMKQWGPMDGTFSLIHLYHLIIKTLSNNADQWVTETMDWWQK